MSGFKAVNADDASDLVLERLRELGVLTPEAEAAVCGVFDDLEDVGDVEPDYDHLDDRYCDDDYDDGRVGDGTYFADPGATAR